MKRCTAMRSNQFNRAQHNPVLEQCLDNAIAHLTAVTDRIEARGEGVEPGPALVRLLGIIEHVEAILDRSLSPETIDRAIQHLQHALHRAAIEIDASHLSLGQPRPSGRSGFKLVS